MLNLDESDDEDMIDFIGDQPIALEMRAQKKVRIAIVSDRLNMLKQQSREYKFPLIEEYDFKRDTTNPDLKIELKPNTMVRDY